MWKICICDDDKSTLTKIKEELFRVIRKEYSDEDFQVITYTTGTMLTGDVEDGYCPDIILMDIKLADGNGIEYAKKILEFNPSCQLIFISGYDDFYLDVYEVDHIYFLRKPVTTEKLSGAIERAMKKAEKIVEKVFSFTYNSKVTILPLNNIRYFEKDRRKINIYTVDETSYEYYGKMEDLLEKLDDEFFIRCHNSYVVNLNKIRGMLKENFLLGADIKIPISRNYSKEAKEKFMEHIHYNF